MKKLQLSVLLCAICVLLINIEANAGDLVDILKEKGIITQEEAKEATEDKAEAKAFKFLEKMDFKGDLRLRHDTQWQDEKDDKYTRNRERFRLRFGIKAKTTETTEVGVRLASGSGFQNTTNQSCDEHARGKEIFIDLAYASWKPTDFLTITGGKQKNPLFTFPLVWDPDVNQEGVSEGLKLDITDHIEIFSNLGQWFIEELNIKDTDRDPTLLVYQLGSVIKPTEKLKLQLALTYYDFENLDAIDWEAGALSDKAEFLGYNHKHNQQMVFDSNQKLLNEFGCWELGAKLTMKDVLPVPFSVFADYIKNEKADINELMTYGVDPGDSGPADLGSYSGDDRDSGWVVGVSVGNKKKKGDWYAKYFYQELEDYAFPAVFVDSDFHGGGTNNKGHYVHGRYFLRDNIQARGALFLTEREDERKDGQKDENRIQLDIVITF
ncbi:MAG: putative porin [Deltaproteobacteria bacterium]|nr:putative porin [Deltaproteobacteria bacterium]